jgi:glycosyltransferase involved in cell wall biosynthesis
MRVMHIIVALTVGGAELLLERLIHLDRDDLRNHKIISLTGLHTVGQRMLAAGIKVESLDVTRPWHIFSGFLKLYWLIRQERPDVVQTWMYHADLIGGLAARLAGCHNVVWNLRTNALPRSAFKLRARMLQRLCAVAGYMVPKRIIVASQAGLDSHVAIGYPKYRMRKIGNGFVIPAQEELDVGRTKLRAEWGLTQKDCAIGMVGSFSVFKDQKNFINAAGRIVDILPNATFFIVGRNCDAANAKLRLWIEEANLDGRIHLLGERYDIPACLAALDVFCLPSLVEGFPNALGEAMAAGKACVTTAAGAAEELLGDHGLLVPVANAPALAEAMARLAAMPTAERQVMGQAARRYIIQTFSMDKMLARYFRLYESLTSHAALLRKGIS